MKFLAEGDITRFLAVFQSEKPANIGPVRSARDYYIEFAKGLKCLFTLLMDIVRKRKKCLRARLY